MPTLGGYPRWQSSVVAASLLGAIQGWWDRVAYAWGWARLAWRWRADQRCAMQEAARLVGSSAWLTAMGAVQATAQTERLHEVTGWSKVGQTLKHHGTGIAENMWRHMHAYALLRDQGPLSNPDAHLLVELAYHEFAASGRGKPPRIA